MTNVLEPAFVPSFETDLLAIDTLRFLAADMVQAANSGRSTVVVARAIFCMFW